ncbi:MAG: DUF2066 domain-containing protein [Proteobacteria bacterium]|nr:DUF2066 domain-containing protein [Pseudomonadota bacterium]
MAENKRAVALIGASAFAIALAAGTSGADAASGDRIFTIGSYPIEARAADAVAAKEKAIAEGQQAAFRSLLMRLVPVTSYNRLATLKATKVGGLIDSFAIRSERNSSTDYIATYDFAFSPEPVRRLLERENIPYLDRQAPQIVVVPAYRIPPEAEGKLPPTFAAAAGSDAWLYAWKGLDLANSLTPVSLQPLKREVHPDTVRILASGDLGQLRTLASAYQVENIVLAVLEPQADLKRLGVVLVGKDAVQSLYLKRDYRLDGQEFAYTAELAAVVSLAILEGRWKAVNVKGGESAGAAPAPEPRPVAVQPQPWGAPGGTYQGSGGSTEPPPTGAPSSGRDGPMTVAVHFQGMAEWQDISRKLAATPDIGGLDVLGLSARGARVSLSYPGGSDRLALALASQGLILQNTRDGWVLTRR